MSADDKWTGGVVLLDRKDINTDEIIPAKYLDVISKEGLGQHLFEDLDDGGDYERQIRAWERPFPPRILVARENFGCGSSREHAVWAIQDAGYTTVAAPSFARIFRENAMYYGLLLVELPLDAVAKIFVMPAGWGRVSLNPGPDGFWAGFNPAYRDQIDVKCRERWSFDLNDFDYELITKGGLIGYAREHY